MLPSNQHLDIASGEASELIAFLSQSFRAGDAAEIIGVPSDTLAHWRKANVVPFEKPGKGWTRYTGADLARFAVMRDAQHLGYSYDLAKEFAQYADGAAEELFAAISGFSAGVRSKRELSDFCLIGLYPLPDLEGPSLSELRKRNENWEPHSAPLVRLFTSQEKIEKHLQVSPYAQTPWQFDYIPTIHRLVNRWAAISGDNL